jgi:hypothetical protein
MADARDYSEVQAEILAQAQAAVAKAISTDAAQQAQAVAWIDGYLDSEGFVVTPGAADAPNQ